VTGEGNLAFLGLPGGLEVFEASAVTGAIKIGVHNPDAAWWNPALTANASITTGSGDDYLNFSRSSGNLKIDGGTCNDSIIGGRGNDYIIAGLGQNTLTGGDGYNRFELKAKGTEFSELDSITDFVSDNDSIWFGTVEMSGVNMIGISGGDYNALESAANTAF